MKEKFQETATVLSQSCLGNQIYDLTIQTKEIAGHAKAGQFISLYTGDASKLLPRPISLCGIDREKGTLRLVYRVKPELRNLQSLSREIPCRFWDLWEMASRCRAERKHF